MMAATGWQRMMKTTAMSAVLLLAVTGCHKKSKLPPPTELPPDTASAVAPPTASITADPLAIDLGQSVVLNWRTTNATSVSIDGIGEVSVNGTQTVSPANSTNFHLVAKGDGGVTEASVRVTVRVGEMPSTPASTGVSTGGDPNDMANVSDSVFHAAVQDIFFGYDSFDLSTDGEASITAAARFLNSHPGVKVLIGGYCDSRGSAEYNITLGENRANAAKTALMSAGIAPGRIRVVSYGKERQFCTEENESCWQQNRRAQFSVDR